MRVVYLTKVLKRYRVPFHEGVRRYLVNRGVSYEVVYGQPDRVESAKGDHGELGWATAIHNRYFGVAGRGLTWQPAMPLLKESDLAIIEQQNGLLINYLLQAMRLHRRPRLAFWGHGRNHQADPNDLAQHWKRWWATKCDWWFAYTADTAKLVASYGFPPDRITVFNNAIDTTERRHQSPLIAETELTQLRACLDISTNNVGLYVGSLYPEKRVPFLLECAINIRRRVPDFVLLVIGDGVDRQLAVTASNAYAWIKYLGPRFGREQLVLLRLARVSLMPGLVGLAILDCASAGLPTVTTAYPYHSPEIAYLRNGHNGLRVDAWESSDAFADAVACVLSDEKLRGRLVAGALQMSREYTMEAMVQRFCDGVVAALAAPRYRPTNRAGRP